MSDPKTELRTEAAERRARAYRANPLAGETLAAVFPAGLRGAVVSGYWPFRTEIDPRPLMRRLARLGATVALPVTPAKGADEALTFRVWRDADDLSRGSFGVPEPSAAAPAVEPDLVLVPLLAFDRVGHRLGYGAGHFDRTLQRLRAFKAVTAVGLAYAVQAVDQLPFGPHDQKLDGVCTERGYTDLRKEI